jgi:hypothetical protein
MCQSLRGISLSISTWKGLDSANRHRTEPRLDSQPPRSLHPPGSHAQPVTTEVGGVLPASWTRMSWKPASSIHARYGSSPYTPPPLVRVISPAAYSSTERLTAGSCDGSTSMTAIRPPGRMAGDSRRSSRRLARGSKRWHRLPSRTRSYVDCEADGVWIDGVLDGPEGAFVDQPRLSRQRPERGRGTRVLAVRRRARVSQHPGVFAIASCG